MASELDIDGNGYSVFRGFFYESISPYVKKELTGQYYLLLYSSKEYEYDGEMRVVKVKESGEETVSYTYDKNGNKKSETLGNGVVSTYDYNNANRIVKFINKKGGEGGIIEKTEYEYDGLKRLTEESVEKGNTTDTYSYEYDDYGNRSKMTATGTEAYETVYNYSVSGKYTALLQMEVKIVEDENAAKLNDNVKQTFYTYDSNGNQVKKIADGKTETNTYNGLNQLIRFTDGSKQIIADVIDNQFYEADCYIRGTNLVAKYNYRNGNKSEYTYYTQNAHGDVVNLTNTDGEVIKSYTYDAFGVEKNIDENDTNAFRYCGEYYDTETGTIYLRARYYNPSTGRFISRDSFAGRRSDPLSLNLYTYCRNNPIRYVDPSGHSFKDIVKGVSSALDNVGKTIEKIVISKKVEDTISQVGKAIAASASAALSLASGAPGCKHGECSIDQSMVNAKKPYKMSQKGIDFMTEYESFESIPYDDGYGNMTIGYGHVILPNEQFTAISESEGKALLANDLKNAEQMITNYSETKDVIWTQNQYDAFVSLAYNSGSNALDVMDMILEGSNPYDAFGTIIHSNGEAVLGLYRRRVDESNIYVKGIYERTYPDWPD